MKDLNEYAACLRESRDLLTPKTFYYLYDGQTLDEMRTRVDMLIYEAEHSHNLTREQVTAWAMQEKEKFDADPANYYHEERPGPDLDTFSAKSLQDADLGDTRFIVDGLLPAGLTVLAAPPKFGKSFLVLDMCLAVSSGGLFLGHKTQKGACLYLALEDGRRRLKERINRLTNNRPAPDGFNLSINAHTLDDGLLAELSGYMDQHPDTSLVVVDTLQKVRSQARGRENCYAQDYKELSLLKAFADEHNIALVLVHHLRKLTDEGDQFAQISGTNGLTGSADTMIVLTREKRNSDTTSLSLTGRDVEAQDLVLRFDKTTCRWENMGDLDCYNAQKERQAYEDSAIVRTVKKLLAQNPTGWEGTAAQLIEAGRYMTGEVLAATPRELTARLKDIAPLLFEIDGIAHTRKGNGSGGGKHLFRMTREAAA